MKTTMNQMIQMIFKSPRGVDDDDHVYDDDYGDYDDDDDVVEDVEDDGDDDGDDNDELKLNWNK
jgi:hypothetical protein